MKKEKTSNAVYVALTDKELQIIDGIAYKINLTRSQLLRNLIRLGLDDIKVMKYSGIIDLIALFRPHERDYADISTELETT